MTEQNPIIAILGGTGKEGRGLALRWASAGYSIIIGSRLAEKAQTAANEINQQLGISGVQGMENSQAARAADICILTVVQAAHQEALTSLKDALQGKILVDATARVDFRDPRPPQPPAAARLSQDFLGKQVRVVAAFQNVPASSLAKLDQPLHSDVLVCSDDLEAAQITVRLAQAAGLQAYHAGMLDNAIVVEGLTALLIALNKGYGVKNASIGVSGLNHTN